MSTPNTTPDSADDIRAQGWTVCIHNDYRLNGKPHTFWGFTKGDRFLKGEGTTDTEALNQVRHQLPTQVELEPNRGVIQVKLYPVCPTLKRAISYAQQALEPDAHHPTPEEWTLIGHFERLATALANALRSDLQYVLVHSVRTTSSSLPHSMSLLRDLLEQHFPQHQQELRKEWGELHVYNLYLAVKPTVPQGG